MNNFKYIVVSSLLIGLICSLASFQASAQSKGLNILRGEVVDLSTAEKLPGATVLVSETGQLTVSDKDGSFMLELDSGKYMLSVHFIGFKTRNIPVSIPADKEIRVEMEADEIALESVEIVSTGFQQLPKERATGSFAYLGQDLVDRRVSTNILERLEDVAPGVIFNRNNAGSDPISIRGRSTLFANTTPLIVIDNLPYEGAIENINPNDVESITVLRDAAAASIWGAQAGNGVIVITTKSGKRGQPLSISFNSNVTMAEIPDLHYRPQMEITDFIDLEIRLFEKGYYNSAANSVNKNPLSPTVETLLALGEGRITQSEADARISAYRNQDFRSELEENYYRKAVNQQYFLQAQGGGDNHNLLFSAGYDRNLSSVIGNANQRITINAKSDFRLLADRLRVSTGIYLGKATTQTGTNVPTGYAYDILQDGQGNHLPITSLLNRRYIDQQAESGLLDWNFVPLDEIGMMDNSVNGMDYRINASLNYKLFEGLDAQVVYQYWNSGTTTRNRDDQKLFSMRHLINNYTQVEEDGQLLRNIPLGDRLELNNEQAHSHNVRFQVNYFKKFKGGSSITALGGSEIRDLSRISDAALYYGYDDATGVSRLVDYLSLFPMQYNPGLRRAIPAGDTHSGVTDRYLSYFLNTSYNFRDRYTLSASGRKDMSNLFGVEANMRGVPLWSAGAAWNISSERFYHWDWMGFMRLKLTYGYNGNVDKSISALTAVAIATRNILIPNLPFAVITNPPNPDLRWERIGITNLALDFESKNSRVAGSIEYYHKKGKDLIGESPVPLSNGILSYTGNFSETKTNGIDLMLTTVNTLGALKWTTIAMASFIDEEVVSFKGARTLSQYLGSSGGGLVPREGSPLFAIYSYRWGGLDPDSGNALGYLDGELSDDYGKILGATQPEDLILHGAARPTYFGALRNELSYKNWNLSANVTYRAGYYFRRRSVNYRDLLTGVISHPDYADRWQQPGDELTTQIPAMPEVLNTSRDSFYQFSSVLVEKGDHVRLQDVRLSYTLGRAAFPNLPFQNMEIYGYANNLGIIWKATSLNLDPDYPETKPLRSIAFGLRVGF
ncbi:SusC/RagA family TonB-linked outer membrane protein [Algoriphagus sp. NG3]|uniref:SusC/RagA family TonB-linked outer membrane protein n=1 Tax=Algoriphagus sp. NG3 TaxID=3097546 RepID=UPI002A8246BF|nr:SusC/RagA family TonB-linked outer membrane protein [Algoriphagus sp. NG3]WPR76273.1 SusC/RagA family TonB-linked outer membrane protein [Algoriphagus sp. NG3]